MDYIKLVISLLRNNWADVQAIVQIVGVDKMVQLEPHLKAIYKTYQDSQKEQPHG